MGKKREILPIITASVIALVVTGIVRWLLPGGTVIKQQPIKKELSLPDIPLMVKEGKKKVIEIQVLVTKNSIKKDEKITTAKLEWKNWPADALQSYFIAKDSKGSPLNNGADYSNAQKMWAKNDIPAGIPLVMDMLSGVDPQDIVRKQQQQKAKEEEKLRQKKLEEEKKKANESGIKAGYRAVTFAIDQKAPVSISMVKPGQLIDVIIEETVGAKTKTHTYTALKIIAIDGKTYKDFEKENKDKSSNAFSGLSLQNFVNPKNITLEIQTNMVHTMLKQAGNKGILLSLRNQDEREHSVDDTDVETEDHSVQNIILRQIADMSRSTAADELMNTKRKKMEEDQNISILLRNLHESANRGTSILQQSQTLREEQEKEGSASKSSVNGGKYEIISGRVIETPESKKQNSRNVVRIYRKLISNEVEFDKSGNRKESRQETSQGR